MICKAPFPLESFVATVPLEWSLPSMHPLVLLQIIRSSANVFAHTVANDEPHKINAPFNLERFSDGRLIDEHGAAAVAH